MTNIKTAVKGETLTITIDLSKRFGKSASGKTTIIASTQGNQTIEGGNGAIFGLNVYTKGE